MIGDPAWSWYGAAGAAGLAALAIWLAWRKGRPFASGDIFRASRLSAGNHLFPTQVLVTPTSLVQYTPRWIGRTEESIHIAHVASVKIDTRLLFSNVLVETTGGSNPISCRGHFKRDAIRIKELIERHQGSYYKGGKTEPAIAPLTTGR